MLVINFSRGAIERTCTTNPFICHDTKRVLITGFDRLTTNLFRSHICQRARVPLIIQGVRAKSNRSYTKITEPDLRILAEENIIWFNVAMNNTLVMSILQSLSYLLHIAHDNIERQAGSFGLTQPAIRNIVHDQ